MNMPDPNLDHDAIDVIAPNLKRRLSGVTTTVLRLVPVQAKMVGIVTTGPGLPPEIPHISLLRAATMPRSRWRVWHARRNNEMVLGLIFRHLFGRRYRLLFTSAAQRDHKKFSKWLIAKMDGVVATSPQAASYLKRDARVIMHGIDTQIFHPAEDKDKLRRELDLPSGRLIGCFGRVRHQKGIDVLIDAALKFLPDRPDVHIVLTGRITPDNQGFVDEQRAKLAKAGLENRVLFRGEVDWEDLVKYYRCLDLFAAPARWEGFGLTPLEAMSCGVAAIATTAGAFEAQIVDGVTGAVVQPGDVDGLANAVMAMLDDPDAMATAGKAGRARVLADFRIQGEAEALVRVYRDLLKDGRL